MRDDLSGAPEPTISALPDKEGQLNVRKTSKTESLSQNTGQGLTTDTKAPVPLPKITTKPQPAQPAPIPPKQNQKPVREPDKSSFYSTPSSLLPEPKTSRDILDELLPIEDKNAKAQSSPIISEKKSVSIAKSVPTSMPPQRVTLPGQISKSSDILKEEIFPSPSMKEDHQETPEELLGLTQKPVSPQKLNSQPAPPTSLDEVGKIDGPSSQIPKPPEFIPTPENLKPPIQISKTIDPQKTHPIKETYKAPTPPPLSVSPKSPKKRKLFLSKSLILTSLSVLIGASLFGTILYLVLSGDESDTKIDTTEKIEEIKEKIEIDITPPPALIAVDFVISNVTVENTLQDTLEKLLEDLKEATIPPDTINYVPIRLEGVVINQKAQYLGATSFLNSLNIITPANLTDILQSNFMLYLYSPGEEERIACQNNLVTEKECWGLRLGLVLKVQPEAKKELQNILSQWLTIAENANLDTLILNDLAQIPTDAVFQQGIYQSQSVPLAPEIVIHYINAPMEKYDNLELSGTALDFAIIDDMLILATSKNSMRKMIDYILQDQ